MLEITINKFNYYKNYLETKKYIILNNIFVYAIITSIYYYYVFFF